MKIEQIVIFTPDELDGEKMDLLKTRLCAGEEKLDVSAFKIGALQLSSFGWLRKINLSRPTLLLLYDPIGENTLEYLVELADVFRGTPLAVCTERLNFELFTSDDILWDIYVFDHELNMLIPTILSKIQNKSIFVTEAVLKEFVVERLRKTSGN